MAISPAGRGSIIGALLGGGKWVAAGGLGAWLANSLPFLKGGAQNAAGDLGEAAVEIESGAAAQNGNIDNFFAGRNQWQGLVGWLSGACAWLFDMTGNKMFADWS